MVVRCNYNVGRTMWRASSASVEKIRLASREIVRELGFMNRTLAGTDLSPSAVHAVLEIGASGGLSAKDLAEKLILEKSTVSRLVRSLVDRGQVRERRAEADGRRKDLLLTRRGEKTLASITDFAERQVAAALAPLPEGSRREVLAGLETYASALKSSRLSGTGAMPDRSVAIAQGYVPGLIGRIVEMHAAYYSRQVGFGAAFETKVVGGLSEFVTRLGKPENAIWRAEWGGQIVGGVAIDGEDLGEGRAHLRWFIVDDGLRGAGVGKALICAAMAFCDARGFRETHLWTFEGLDAARHLYEKHGFVLAEEYRGDQWGKVVLEQKFVRPRRAQ